MVNGIRTDDPRRFNKGHSSKFHVGSRVQQTPEEGRRTYQPKRCGNNDEDEDNSPKTLNNKKKTLHYFKMTYLTIVETSTVTTTFGQDWSLTNGYSYHHNKDTSIDNRLYL